MLIMLVLAYWSGQTDLALCSLYMAESEVLHKPSVCSSNQDSQQAATARRTRNLSVNVYMLLMVSRFGQVELAACARLKCCTNPVPAAIAQQPADSSRAATEQFQPHIMQAFASTPIRMCWFSQKILQPVASFTWLLWACCTNLCVQPWQTTTGRRQIQKSLQLHGPELSGVAHASWCTYACLFLHNVIGFG
jgi:hypothetical protein